MGAECAASSAAAAAVRGLREACARPAPGARLGSHAARGVRLVSPRLTFVPLPCLQGVLRAPQRAITQVLVPPYVAAAPSARCCRHSLAALHCILKDIARAESTWLEQTVALFGLGGPAAGTDSKYPIIADEEVMKKKAHGTSEKPVMKNLKWGADFEVHAALPPPVASLACRLMRTARCAQDVWPCLGD